MKLESGTYRWQKNNISFQGLVGDKFAHVQFRENGKWKVDNSVKTNEEVRAISQHKDTEFFGKLI